VVIEKTVEVPTGAHVLEEARLEFPVSWRGASAPSPWMYVDDFQVWLESPSAAYELPEAQSIRESLWGRELILEDPDENYAGASGLKSAKLGFSSNPPHPNGEVYLAATNTGNKNPDLKVNGVLTGLGDEFLDSNANALEPRIEMNVRDSTFTLLEEHGIAGSPKTRVYHWVNSGAYQSYHYTTNNARWDGSQWVSDEIGSATAHVVGSAGTFILEKWTTTIGGGETWVNSGWSAWDRRSFDAGPGGVGYPHQTFGRTGNMNYGPLVINGFGGLHYRGIWIYDEFEYLANTIGEGVSPAYHNMWDEFVILGAGITERYNNLSRVRLNNRVFIYRRGDVCTISDNPGFVTEVMCRTSGAGERWFIGFVRISNYSFGFWYDHSALGSNLHVGIDAGSGTYTHFTDTGVSVPAKMGDWLVLQAMCVEGDFSSCRVLWSVQDAGTLQSVGEGVYSPGVPVLNSTNSHNFQYYVYDSDIVVERLLIYTSPAE